VYNVPEIANLGAVFKSSQPSELTESETEYVVKCTKHVFNEYISLQFSVTNTIPDQLLCNVGEIYQALYFYLRYSLYSLHRCSSAL